MSILCKAGLHRWKAHYVKRKEFRTVEVVFLPFGFDFQAFALPIKPTNLWPAGSRCTHCGKRK